MTLDPETEILLRVTEYIQWRLNRGISEPRETWSLLLSFAEYTQRLSDIGDNAPFPWRLTPNAAKRLIMFATEATIHNARSVDGHN